jgi:L-fuculose-phosphate aldolase
MTAFSIDPIGILQCNLQKLEETPKNYDESEHSGIIKVYPQFLAGLEGIRRGDTIVVLFWLDRADRSVLRVHPRGDKSKPKRGVFSTRSPVRPNPIAVSELYVEDIHDNVLTVRGLDILDSTPVIDIKKKLYSDKIRNNLPAGETPR